MVNDSLSALLELAADVDEIIPFKRRAWSKLKNLPDLIRFLGRLRRESWDCVIDFQGLFRSGICAYLAGEKGKTYGFAQARELAPAFYSRRIEAPDELVHAIDKNIYLVNQVLGCDESWQPPAFKRSPAVTRDARELMAEFELAEGMLAVAPASRWPSKTWPAEFFAEVITRVAGAADFAGEFWLLGTADERDVGDQVIALAGDAKISNLMGRTGLAVMVELLRHSSLLLTNDSGPMHIAAALEIPTVALFGPTSPEKTGPYGANHHILRTRVDCAPCFKRECPLPRQLCRDDLISPEETAACITETFKGNSPKPPKP